MAAFDIGGFNLAITKEREGLLNVPGGRVWYKIVGGGPGVPLLLLHGGPGAGHDYLEPLEALGDARPVVFYEPARLRQVRDPERQLALGG